MSLRTGTQSPALTLEPPTRRNNGLRIMDRGTEPYEATLAVQEHLVADRQAGRIPDTLVLVEHPSVFTLGRSARTSDLLKTPDELEQLHIPVISTSRGGQITYHGPGQLVAYPILELAGLEEGPAWYVGQLEQVLIRTLAHFGVTATGDSRNRGVWVGTNKIAAIGVRITRRVTLHGLALNVRMDLTPYQYIIPCGIRDRGVTSLHLLRPEIALDNVKHQIIQEFRTVFDRTAVP